MTRRMCYSLLACVICGPLHYLRSRNVDDFEEVCDLLVSDKLKTCLTGGQLNYVLSLEGEDWFRPE